MDRQLVYPGALSQDGDLLGTNKNVMIALGMALQAILGTTTQVDGLACTPTIPASMQVLIGPGSIMGMAAVDASPYGSLAADTSDQIMKQGILLGSTPLNCPAPTGAGTSIIYLIQAEFAEVDGGQQVLPYYNASNPSQPYSGPPVNGISSGTANFTKRQGLCVLSAKPSAAAANPVAPTPDPGYVGLYYVTVPNGLAAITSANISVYSAAPFIGTKLNALAPLLSPFFTGAPRAPTPGVNDNTNAIATTAYVQNSFSNNLLSYSGYMAFPGPVNARLFLQWMQVSLTLSGSTVNGFYGAQASFNWPTVFPNSCLIAFATPINTAGVEGGAAVSNPSATGVAVAVQNTSTGSSPANVFGIGY